MRAEGRLAGYRIASPPRSAIAHMEHGIHNCAKCSMQCTWRSLGTRGTQHLTLRESNRKEGSLGAIIDLRSDTVTRPSAEMRAAMAAAEVGDDVYGEDPTVNLLERRAAEVFGREAALFVPTGTMGNQIGIRLHTKPGQEVIAESRAHILDWEMATTAVFSGCLIRPVYAERGILTWKHIEPVIQARGAFRAATGLIEIENTANLAGGSCTPVEVLEEIWENAKERKLPTHLDGARIFNAAVALGTDVKALTHGFDTVM